jgi:hypothetical protein
MTMESFISSCLQGRLVDVYCGDGAWFHGEVVTCVDGVLGLKSGITYTNVAVEKIIGIWETCKEEYDKRNLGEIKVGHITHSTHL